MFTIYDEETKTRTLISEKNIDYLACDLEQCILRYRNICSPEVLKEYEKLVKTKKSNQLTVDLLLPKYRYAMPHLDKNAKEASKLVREHNTIHGCDGNFLTRVFPKGDPNYDTLLNRLNHN